MPLIDLPDARARVIADLAQVYLTVLYQLTRQESRELNRFGLHETMRIDSTPPIELFLFSRGGRSTT